MPIAAKAAPKTGGNVINLMDALKRSLSNEKQSAPQPAKARKSKKRVEGQREMLLPISGKRGKEEPKKEESKKQEPKKPVRAPARAKKAG